ncbi:MAG: serine hydrolase domain-containing protein [Lacibacter sp.]
MKKAFLLFLFFSFQHICIAQSWQDTVLLIVRAMADFKPEKPGAQLAISRNGQLIFSQAWGMADLEHNVALTTESIIEAGSVSKQFTAAAILLLEQQGKLSIDDDVRKYIPELPDYGATITLRHLMHHTSGIKDWGAIAAIGGWPRTTKTYSNHDALLIMCRQKTLNNLPGDEFIYSNSGYNLFAIIVERVSGESLAEFTRKNIFLPAGMKHTEWRNNFKKIVHNRAIAYSRAGNTYFMDMPNEYVYGNGGLLTTAEDLLLWNNYYMAGKFGNSSLLPMQLSTTALNSGKHNNYAAGLIVDSVRGWKSISHTGATAGYRSMLQHFPDLGLTIAWLLNSSDIDNGPNVAVTVRNLLVKDMSVVFKKAEPVFYNIPVEKLKNYTGWYRDKKTAAANKLVLRNDTLRTLAGNALFPIAENIFVQGQARMEVTSGIPATFLLINGADSVLYVAADSAQTDEKHLQEYAGDYLSDEADAKLTIKVKDGKLMAQQEAPVTEMLLVPTYKDGFRMYGFNVYFERNKKNKITSLHVFSGRARNVVFVKQTK